ncbi:MAG: GNAT family N-acetyltransferase [Bowdeniella nasicola]|nr:GNAT family N-acetyltransferase [Bowdeniella nasicola]
MTTRRRANRPPRAQVHVRPMTLADAHDVARVHVASWQQAYPGIMPQHVLDSLSVQDRTAALHRRLRTGSPMRYLVGEVDGKIAGFATVGPCRDEDSSTDDAELVALYVDPPYLRRGVGTALLNQAKVTAKGLGCRRMILWVLKENSGARAFYRRAGLRQESTRGTYSIAGTDLVKMRYSCPV